MKASCIAILILASTSLPFGTLRGAPTTGDNVPVEIELTATTIVDATNVLADFDTTVTDLRQRVASIERDKNAAKSQVNAERQRLSIALAKQPDGDIKTVAVFFLKPRGLAEREHFKVRAVRDGSFEYASKKHPSRVYAVYREVPSP